MYSPISESSLSQELRTERKLRFREKHREKRRIEEKSSQSSPDAKKKHKKKCSHHSKERSSRKHDRGDLTSKKRTSRKDSREKTGKTRSSHRHSRNRSRDKRVKFYAESSSKLHRYRNATDEESSTENEFSQSSFISEMLRNSKSEKVIDKKEATRLLDSLKIIKEDGEIISDEDCQNVQKASSEITNNDEGSFTPPINLLSLLSYKKLLPAMVEPETEVDHDLNKIDDKTSQAHPKKKSVLDLPMPPIIYQSNAHKRNSLKSVITSALKPSAQPKEIELKPEQFTQLETNFTEMRDHLTVNPVVISPNDTFSTEMPFKALPRKKPIVLNRKKSAKDLTMRSFDSYEIIQQVGEGTYGKVFKAKDLLNDCLVAMKFILMDNENDGFPITGLREINILRELQHPNIIQLHQIVHDETNPRKPGTYLVFEYMNHDLMGLLDNESMVFDEISIYQIFRQILEGLDYCHRRLILHRDLKCSNILVNQKGEVKLADFGLGRPWVAERPYTNRVISLWYRPIELLLGEEKYGSSVDMWSLGCIFGELFQRRPIFPYATTIETITGIFNLCGTPTISSWPEVKYLPGFRTLQPKICHSTLMDTYNRLMPSLALDLFSSMLCLNPTKRITAADALKSNWILVMSEKKLFEALKLPVEHDCHEMNVKIRRKKRTSNCSSFAIP